MIVMSPARADDQITLRSDSLAEVIRTIGTNGYGRACLGLFEQSLDADHWALFHYRASNSVGCVATASRMYAAAAQENINRFVGRCYRVDPSLILLKQQHPESACVIRIEIAPVVAMRQHHVVVEQIGERQIGGVIAIAVYYRMTHFRLELHPRHEVGNPDAFPRVVESRPCGHAVEIGDLATLRQRAEFLVR